MVYWLILVVIGYGAGEVTGSPRVPIPVSTQILHVGNFASQSDCMAAAAEAQKANGSGNPGASYRMLCVRSSDSKAPSPAD